MSWTFDLCDSETQEILSNKDSELSTNVLYNYADTINRVFPCKCDFVSCMDGMSGADSIPLLTIASSQLHGDATDDIWEDTEGNAKVAVDSLLNIAILRPDGVWSVF
jgi:hypothetical protein